MSGQTSLRLALPSLRLAGNTVLLLRDGIPGVVEHLFDLRERHFLRVVVDVDSPGWDINLDLAHSLQFSNGPFNRVLAMLARNVWRHKGCRFHDAYPPLILSDRLKSKQYNVPLQRCETSGLPFERGHDSI